MTALLGRAGRFLALPIALMILASCDSAPEEPGPTPSGTVSQIPTVSQSASVSQSATFSGCAQPADAWLDTLAGEFYPDHRDATIERAAYVEVETTDGSDAFYIALEVDTVGRVAVFGTSKPPLRSDLGLTAAANAAAEELSDLGLDIPVNSSAGQLLKDANGVATAEACL